VLPISAVAVFAIAGNLCEYASKVAGALSKTITPRVSALKSLGSLKVGEAVLLAARLATLACTPIAMTFLIRGKSFIGLWMGAEFGPSSGAVLEVLALMVWIGGVRAVAISAIIGANRHRLLIPVLAGEAVSNLGLSIVLANAVGVVGVAIRTVIPGTIVTLVFIPIYLRLATGVSLTDFYWRALWRPTVACLPFLLATLLFEQYLPARNLLMFFLQVLLVLPLVPLSALFLCATPTERQNVLAFARRFTAGTG